MRKRMLTAALAALLLGGCGAPAADPAASEPPASGAAAEAETPTADADTNAAPDAAGADPVVTETNTTYYLPDGTVAAETRTTYVYDETGLALSAQVELDGAVLMRTENVYDEAGLRTQALVYDGEGNLTATNTFDAAGNLLSLTGRPQAPGADGEVQEISQTHTYDEQGRLVESESVTAAGTQLDRYTYNGDGTGRMESTLNSEAQYTDALTLDEAGNILTRTRTDSAGQLTSERTATYNENGDPLTETTTDADGAVVSETVCTYDEAGNLLTQTQTIQGTPREISCTYDGHGNQLSSRRTEDGVLAEESVSTVLPLDEALARQG